MKNEDGKEFEALTFNKQASQMLNFVRMVWKASTKFGFAQVKYTNEDGLKCRVSVAVYNEPGNGDPAKYKENVLQGSFDASNDCKKE